jgi:hypothetical protein
MKYKQDIDRNQTTLLPPSVEDYLPSNHLILVINHYQHSEIYKKMNSNDDGKSVILSYQSLATDIPHPNE